MKFPNLLFLQNCLFMSQIEANQRLANSFADWRHCADNHNYHCTKSQIFFSQMFWKDGFSKKIALKYDPSCIIRKGDISFSRKFDLIILDVKRKMIFLKKMLWKGGLSEKMHWKMIFFVISGKRIFLFSQKYGIFS